MSTLEKLVEQGMQKGREEGLEKGREEGRRYGIIEGLSTALEIKFGVPGLQLLAKIEQMDLEHLFIVKALIKDVHTLKELKRKLTLV